MSVFWLDNGSTTYDIDANIVSVELGNIKRRVDTEDYMGANGGILKGFGTYSSRTITLNRIETRNSDNISAWNDERNALIAYLTLPVTDTLYFYMRDGEDTIDLRTRVYVQDLGSELFKHTNYIASRSIKLLAPDCVFENSTATTGSQAITGVATGVAITNAGNVQSPCQFKYTPTGVETSFIVELYDDYSFTLEGSFAAGKQIVFNTYNNQLTMDGIVRRLSEYLTSGSLFHLPVGTNTVTVTASGAGTFAYEFNARYV